MYTSDLRNLQIWALLVLTTAFQCLAFAGGNMDQKVNVLLSKMSLEEKVGQMTQLNITTIIQDTISDNYSHVKNYVMDTAKITNFVKNWHVGSFLNGRAVSPENWVYVTGTIQEINARYSDIPILYGIDHMHGASYLKTGTIFPHNLSIGCSFDTRHAFNAARTAV